jgi:hypothetical protein
VFMGVLRIKFKHTVIQKYFFLDIMINVKAGRVIFAPGKYIMGAALDRPAVERVIQPSEGRRSGG